MGGGGEERGGSSTRPPSARVHGALMAVVAVVAVVTVVTVVVWTMTMISAIYADEGVLVCVITVFVGGCADGERSRNSYMLLVLLL